MLIIGVEEQCILLHMDVSLAKIILGAHISERKICEGMCPTTLEWAHCENGCKTTTMHHQVPLAGQVTLSIRIHSRVSRV